mgnify:CR=1 FL=1
MKVGISTASLFLREPTERAAATIKSLGVDETEVFLQTFYEYRPEFSKALAPDICGLNVNSVHVLTNDFEPHLFSPSRRIRGDGFYWLDQVMRSAQLLNCKNYTFHGQCLIKKGCAFSDYDGLANISAARLSSARGTECVSALKTWRGALIIARVFLRS